MSNEFSLCSSLTFGTSLLCLNDGHVESKCMVLGDKEGMEGAMVPQAAFHAH